MNIGLYMKIGLGHLVGRLIMMAIKNEDDPLIKSYNDYKDKWSETQKVGFAIGGAIGIVANVVLWPINDIALAIQAIDLLNKGKDESAE